jgi:hypothetical protein
MRRMLTRDIPLETAQSRRRWATIYGIPCFAAPSGGGFLGNRFEDIKMYLNLSYNSWLATDSDYFYDSRNRWLL